MKGYHNSDCYDHQQHPNPAEYKSKARQAGNKAAPYIWAALAIISAAGLLIMNYL